MFLPSANWLFFLRCGIHVEDMASTRTLFAVTEMYYSLVKMAIGRVAFNDYVVQLTSHGSLGDNQVLLCNGFMSLTFVNFGEFSL